MIDEKLTDARQERELKTTLKAANTSLKTEKIITALNRIIGFYQNNNNFEMCANYSIELLPHLQNAGNEPELAKKQVYIGTCFVRISEYCKAEEYYSKAMEIYLRIGDKFGFAETNVNMGMIYRKLGQFEQSLSFLNEAMTIYQKHKSLLMMEENSRPRDMYSSALEVLGIIYGQLKQFEKSRYYLQQNLEIQRQIQDPLGVVKSLLNLGASYSESESDKALECYLEAHEITTPEFPIYLRAAVINNIGGSYEDSGDFDQALDFYYQALKLLDDNQQVKFRPAILKHIGTVYFKKGMFAEALTNVQQSLELSTAEEAKVDMQECYQLLSEIFAAQRDFQSALEHRIKYDELKFQIFNQDMVSQLKTVQQKYEETSIRLLEVQKYNSLVTEALKKSINMSFVGVSESIRKVHELAMTAAMHSKTNILITGESGVGKEIVARLIHFAGKEKSGLFVDVNCSSIPESLAESEFFGYTKGAFTGAMNSKAGFLEEANNGTLFLDEIGDTPLILQAKFLRVLETKQVKRLGSNQSIQIDFRLISATNKDLNNLIKDNLFRSDLMYRINTIEIHIPPLRERKDDIEPLLNHYLGEFAKIMKKPVPRHEASLLKYLQAYDFPGNVRELKNMIEKAMILLSKPMLSIDDFEICATPSVSAPVSKPVETINTMEEMEYTMMQDALRKAGGNKTKAAQILGISYSTFRRKYKDS